MSTPNRRLHEDSGSGNHSHPSDGGFGSEIRMEFRGSKYIIKEIKVENCVVKSESRELQQTAKCDKYDSRCYENKDSKSEMITYSEPKDNEKLDKDCCDGSSYSQLNWKDTKEQHHLKQYLDVSGGNAGTWHTSPTGLLGPTDTAKEGLHVGNADIAGKCVKKESSTLEPKKKDHDTWKNVDREARDNKKKRDADEELERPDKRSRCRKKELDEGGMHAEEGKSDVSCVVYKIGEHMQELIQLWKEYELLQADKACEGSPNGPTLEIQIPAKHVTSTNRQVRNKQLWGTDVYTVDSDLVAGYCRPTASPRLSATEELRATIRVLPPQDCYISTLRNNIHSRAWRAPIDCSYCVECCCFVKQGGGIVDLEPRLTLSSTMEPTFAPVVVEHKMTTRTAASKVLRQKRFLSAVTFQYSFCMEPWYVYSINVVADQGLKPSLFSSARLKKGEVLYVETHFRRYELCFNGEKVIKAAPGRHDLDSESSVVNVFRWSRCKRYLTQKDMLSVGIPLPLEYVEVLEENLDWEDDILWSRTGVFIAGREYHLARALFLLPN